MKQILTRSEIPGINNRNNTWMSHLPIGAKCHRVSGIGEHAGPDGRLGVDALELLSGLHVPQPHGVVCGAGQEVSRLPVHVQTPHGARVALAAAAAEST